YGEGRMAEPGDVLDYIEKNFFLITAQAGPLSGKKALVTAGPTYEPIDPVRFIGNHSSGKMGIAIADELHRQGATVTLIMGPSTIAKPADGIKLIRVKTAEEMYEATNAAFEQSDLAVMAAAVADYTPVEMAEEKIKKKEERLIVELTKTKDILK